MSHSDVQKGISHENGIMSFNILCTGSHKRLWMYYVFWLEMAGRIVSFFNLIILHFNKLWDTYAVYKQYTGTPKRLTEKKSFLFHVIMRSTF